MLDHPIELHSELGRGSHFSVRRAARAGAAGRARAPRPPRAPRCQLAGLAVLCIDNEPTILDGMETLLTGWGCRVSKAADLEGALACPGGFAEASSRMAAAEAGGPLVDYHLDRGNGLEVIAALRARCGPICRRS